MMIGGAFIAYSLVRRPASIAFSSPYGFHLSAPRLCSIIDEARRAMLRHRGRSVYVEHREIMWARDASAELACSALLLCSSRRRVTWLRLSACVMAWRHSRVMPPLASRAADAADMMAGIISRWLAMAKSASSSAAFIIRHYAVAYYARDGLASPVVGIEISKSLFHRRLLVRRRARLRINLSRTKKGRAIAIDDIDVCLSRLTSPLSE